MLAVECESILLIILAVAVANIIQELEVKVPVVNDPSGTLIFLRNFIFYWF